MKRDFDVILKDLDLELKKFVEAFAICIESRTEENKQKLRETWAKVETTLDEITNQ